MNVIDLAWAAGFFDGEGCTTLYSKPRRTMDMVRQPTLTVSQCNRGPLERFQRAVFGLGRIYGPYQRPRGRPQYVWRATRWRDAQAVIALLWKFLTPEKQEQALKAFRAYKASISSGRLCWNGLHHKPRRYGKCKECAKEAIYRWRRKPGVAARLRAYATAYRAANPDRVRK